MSELIKTELGETVEKELALGNLINGEPARR